MSEFHFDFNAVQGLELATGAEILFRQMEDHYNENFKVQSVVFGGSQPKATAVVLEDRQPTNQVAAVVSKAEPVGPVDTETVTPKTVNMKTFSIKDGKELGLKEGDTILKGVTDKGVEVFDKLLPGYDEQPYGPVVQGESGRYNLNPKGAK